MMSDVLFPAPSPISRAKKSNCNLQKEHRPSTITTSLPRRSALCALSLYSSIATMSSLSTSVESFDGFVAPPRGFRYARRGACVLTTLDVCRSASIVAYEVYEADLRVTSGNMISFPDYLPSVHDSTTTSRKRCMREVDGSSDFEGARDIKRRGSVDR